MAGNPSQGRARAAPPGDLQPLRKTAMPQKLYCSIEMRTISPAGGAGARCGQQGALASWGRLNGPGAAETRYDQSFIIHSIHTTGDDLFHDAETMERDSRAEGRRRGRPGKGQGGRNARERRRVRAVSSAFLRLRKAVPPCASAAAPAKRLSKLKTLKSAISYISELQRILTLITGNQFQN